MCAYRTARALSLLVAAALLLGACAKSKLPPPVPEPPDSAPIQVISPPAEPVSAIARLILDVPLGDSPHLPGRTPSRVGGVSPRGPQSLAVAEGGDLWLLDQANSRLMRFTAGEYQDSLALPWLSEWSGSLLTLGDRFLLRSGSMEYLLDQQGRILARQHPSDGASFYPTKRPDQEAWGKGAAALGQDGHGLVYVREAQNATVMLTRKDGDGRLWASAHEPQAGALVDWHVSPAGGLYTLTWVWGEGRIERALVHEVLPPLAPPPAQGPALAAAPPTALGLPVPTTVRITPPGWFEVTVTDPVALNNLWFMLSRSRLENEPPSAHAERPFRLSLTLPGGGTQAIELYHYSGVMDGQRIAGDHPEAMQLLSALVYSPQAIRQALADAAVSVAIADLPGVVRALTAQEKQALAGALEGARPVNPASAPQPLEQPFPRYSLRLADVGWQASLELRGDRHLSIGREGALLTSSKVAELIRGALPVPQPVEGDVALLYWAERLEVNGQDLTRWQATVVRHLLGVAQRPEQPLTHAAPLTFTFYLDGKPHEVQVDAKGFVYAGKRYERPGLTDLAGLQGVP